MRAAFKTLKNWPSDIVPSNYYSLFIARTGEGGHMGCFQSIEEYGSDPSFP